MCGERCDRARRNAAASDVRAPGSSIETHRFMANGFAVSERISAITSSIALGSSPGAPNDPSPPKFDTAAVSLCDERPPSGPRMIGYSIPRTLETRVWFHAFAIMPPRTRKKGRVSLAPLGFHSRSYRQLGLYPMGG